LFEFTFVIAPVNIEILIEADYIAVAQFVGLLGTKYGIIKLSVIHLH